MARQTEKKQSIVFVNGHECQCISITINKDIAGMDKVAMEFYPQSVEIKEKNGIDEVTIGM